MSTAWKTGLASLTLVAVSALAAPKPAKPAAKPANGEQLFTSQVRAILQSNCASCHSGEKPMGNLNLTTRDFLLKGGASGPAVDLAKPDASLIVTAIHGKGRIMPPKGRMAQRDIDAVTQWVRLGAPWPGSKKPDEAAHQAHLPPKVTPETMKFWAYQPVRRPSVPKLQPSNSKDQTPNPIDAFVRKTLRDNGLSPNPPAPREQLIRRAYYDIWGLPPSPEEVAAFVADKSPNAWEKVVDKLLASPHYGEKWGRHWLDLVRYAESNSYERDGLKPNAWRYRDYVINSFNSGKPYDQFVLEQLAGDELEQRTPERLIATGYYRLGIWDDEPVDPEQALYDDLDDVVNTTGQVFLGMTVGCARCHDHKIDPFPQKDYYRFLAFFSGYRRFGERSYESIQSASLRPIGPEEETKAQAAEIAAHQVKVRENIGALRTIERKVYDDLSPVEKEEWRNEDARLAIIRKRSGNQVTAEEIESYAKLAQARNELRRFRPRGLEEALCIKEIGSTPRETFILGRGNASAKGEKVEPGFPTVLAPPDPQYAPIPHKDTSGRRLTFAKWVTSPSNPLTARVIVNRVWHYHFGRGIVRSTSDFGFQGDKPTHPELLDYLASVFSSPKTPNAQSLTPGFAWEFKPLHKLIMLSQTYQQSAAGQPTGLAKDPENQFLWRFNMRRLEAEEVRDSILAVIGSLNPKRGGPSIFPTIPDEVLAGQSMPGAGWGRSTPEEQRRRSVYIFVKRSLAVPLIAAFDGPETDFSCSARFATTQPTQALGAINSTWMNEQAHIFAKHVREKAGAKVDDQVALALTRVTQRKPTPGQIARGVKLITELQQEDGQTADAALATFCLVALNLNEFLYLD